MRIILGLIIFGSVNQKVYAQIENYSEYHKFYIEGENIIEEIIIRGKITDNDGNQISVSYNGLETITDLKLSYHSTKFKKVKQKDFIKTAVISSSFYDGLHSLKYFINKPAEYTLSYKITRNDIMYITSLDFYTYYKCDTLNYELNLPKGFFLLFDMPSEIENLNIDSTINELGKKYVFCQNKNTRTALADLKKNKASNIIWDKTSKVVRLQISTSENHNKTFNDWYYKLVESTGELDVNSKKEIDDLVIGISNKDSVAKKIFEFVQTKIRYLAIEDGVNAFVPRNVNDILSKRQGDCKDMSNLLVKAYNYKGIDANIAIASSLGHRFKLNFPNLASANHVVCVIKKGQDWLIADATDKYCQYSLPSAHMQGRNVFIIDKMEGVYHHIKKIEYKNNLDSTFADLRLVDGKVIGEVEIIKKGLANRKYVAFKDYFNSKVLDEKLKKNIASDYDIYTIDSLKYNINFSSSTLSFNISQRQSNLTVIKQKTYLPVNLLLRNINPFPDKINKNTRLITYGAIHKKGKILIDINKRFELVKEFGRDLRNDLFAFSYKMAKLPNHVLMVEYEVIIDAVELGGEAIEGYNTFNKELKSILNKSIIYDQEYN